MSPLNKIHRAILLVTLIIFSSGSGCSPSKTSNIEIDNFFKHENEFNQLVRILERRYINVEDRKNLSRKTILLCDGIGRFGRDDYRICDDQIESYMERLNISVITMEKDICEMESNFDLVKFELSNQRNKYYGFSFCDSVLYSDFESSSVYIKMMTMRWFFVEEK